MSRPNLFQASTRLFSAAHQSNRRLLPSNNLYQRQFASSSTNKKKLSKNTFSDHLTVLGLLTVTTLIGVGIGIRAKSQQNIKKQNEQDKQSLELEKQATSTMTEENQKQETSENKDDESEIPKKIQNREHTVYPETGEINWGCPCLGGMAHGTCGEQFKAAFSCFVYSEQEPKGVECIERFKEMQDCFKEHPDEYGPELTDNDDSMPDEGPEPTDDNDSTPDQGPESTDEDDSTPDKDDKGI
ncbi:hypothetical protein PSTT_00864 [Puccinia striiformis]|uniref:Mitochondrial intermembrane space import and assembly protein 40 n=1 Tax=Puccinia striiformis TaxID=27350 RepID=A0A2S4W5L3_9BASI|nr:hypothetical protein PSTT_00864 [Puccinia striiformis]